MWINKVKNMIALCETHDNFHCGIYINREPWKRVAICNTIKDLVKNRESVSSMIMSKYSSELYFKNGSHIRVINADDRARAYKNSMVLIDEEIDERIDKCIIKPTLIHPAIEEYFDIDDDDIGTAENLKEIEKEKYMNRPFLTKEIDCKKIMYYNAMGLDNNSITYYPEFVNKTKESYLIVKGCFEMSDDFKNEIDLRITIDTNIYDGYEVAVDNGILTVVLHEIKNTIPQLRDYNQVA